MGSALKRHDQIDYGIAKGSVCLTIIALTDGSSSHFETRLLSSHIIQEGFSPREDHFVSEYEEVFCMGRYCVLCGRGFEAKSRVGLTR